MKNPKETKLGEGIRKHRKKLGLSIYNFSIQADINYSTLGNIEIGQSVPSAKTAVRILNTLNIGFNDCLGESNLSNKEFYINNIASNLMGLNREDLDILQLIALSIKPEVEDE